MSTPIIGNPVGFFHDPLETTLPLMAELGYDQIEICHSQIPEYKTPKLREQFHEFVRSLGMQLVGSNVPNSDYFQTLNDPEDVKVALAGIQGDLDIAVDLGVQYLITFEGRVPAGASEQQLFGRILDDTVDLLQKASQYAAEREIDLLIEVHPFTLGINVEFAVQLCDRVNMENFGIAYDPCHFGVGLPDGYIDAIGTLSHRIKHVHFSDSDKKSSEVHFPPGRGCLDMEGIVRALQNIHFSGCWMLDLFLYPLPIWGSKEGIPYMREMLASLNRDD